MESEFYTTPLIDYRFDEGPRLGIDIIKDDESIGVYSMNMTEVADFIDKLNLCLKHIQKLSIAKKNGDVVNPNE